MKGSGWGRARLRVACLAASHRLAAPRSPPTQPRAAESRRPSASRSPIPYIELRTGPGRGYPIFFVAPRGEQIDIELRHTDWFRVRTVGGKVGWVHRQQLETTLTAAGSRRAFATFCVDDYLSRKVQLGAAWGQFKSEPMLKVWDQLSRSPTR